MANPPTWNLAEFPFINESNPSLNMVQQGIVTNVPADGSGLISVTFAQAYAANVTVEVSINEASQTFDDLNVRAVNITLTGFQIYVTGGALGTFTTVGWMTSGN